MAGADIGCEVFTSGAASEIVVDVTENDLPFLKFA